MKGPAAAGAEALERFGGGGGEVGDGVAQLDKVDVDAGGIEGGGFAVGDDASPSRPRSLVRLQRSAPLGSSGISQKRWQSRSRRTGFASAAR